MKIVWMSYDEAEELKCNDLGSMGERGISITLKEFINQYNKKSQKYIRLIAKNIKDNLYIFGGDSHQMGENCCPVVFNIFNKPLRTFMASYRCWGDLMHCIHVDKSGEDLGYMDFYMNICIPDNYVIKYPHFNTGGTTNGS